MRDIARLGVTRWSLGHLAISGQFEIKQTVRVVKCWAQDLPAGQVLERGRDASIAGHNAGIERLGRTKARQSGAIGANEEDRFDQIATRLLDCKCRKVRIIKRPFGHDAIDGKT